MDGEQHPPPEDEDGTTMASILGVPRQRRILSILRDLSRPLTVDELAARLAVDGTDADPSDVSGATLDTLRSDLRYRCLPRLDAAGWIDRRPDGYVLDDPLPLETDRLSLPELCEPDHPLWAVVTPLLARHHRPAILSIVDSRSRSLPVADLVAALRDREGTRTDDARALSISLHHVDLPKLDDLGLVDYDPDEWTVAPTPRLSRCVDRLGIDAD